MFIKTVTLKITHLMMRLTINQPRVLFLSAACDEKMQISMLIMRNDFELLIITGSSFNMKSLKITKVLSILTLYLINVSN